MRVIYTYIYIVIAIICFGCNDSFYNSNLKKIVSINERDNNFEIYFINEFGDKHGTYMLFSNDSIKILETNFINNIKNGTEKQYYPNGSIEYIGFYKDGLSDSLWTWYYPTGKIQIKEFWFKNKLWGDKIGYYENGNIDYIAYYDIDGDAVFMREYEESGRLKNSENVPMQYIVNKFKLEANEMFELKILTSAYEDFDNYLSVYIMNDKTKEKQVWAENISIQSLIVKQHSKIEILRRKMPIKGNFTIQIIGGIIDKPLNDTIPFQYEFKIFIQ